MIIQNGRTFHLQGKSISYVLYRSEEEDLLNFHFGQIIADMDYSQDFDQLIEPYPFLNLNSPAKRPNLSTFPQECSTYGHIDMRVPSLEVKNALGNELCALKFESGQILHGQAASFAEMPSLFAVDGDFDTLEISLLDRKSGIRVRLQYAVSDKFDVIARSAVIENCGEGEMELKRVYSMNLDLPVEQYDLIHFCGDWGQERRLERTPIHRGMNTDICDNTGRSSRWNNPFVMIASPDASETNGTVYGFNLIYSGNHSTVVSMDCASHVRIMQGISPMGFSWKLAPGEQFQTPQSVLAFSAEGFDRLSQEYHKLYMTHLMKSRWTHRQRPILINNWEATYFDFNEEKLLAMAEKAKRAGMELFVLDDGWFGKRDSARLSLGDWVVNRQKLPDGISGLAKKINDLGLSFGLWFEPEMVSLDSELYRAHPDWIVRVPQLEPVQYRWQYVLDLTRTEVCDHVVEAVSAVLRDADISYLKWDMNRMVSDTPYPGFYHRYCLGYYRIVRALTERFPDILFEGCASGGGRFDPGVLSYMPQIWTSDDSDAIARLRIQHSTSMCYPLSTMAAHVSAVPNHQIGRVTSLKTRGDVASFGMFGYELDITKMTDEELSQIREQAEFAKHIQPLVREGRFHRLRSPYETNECIWQVVSENRDHVYVMGCRVLAVIMRNRHFDPKVCLRDLDEDAVYEDVNTKKRYPGSLLMHRGLIFRYAYEDFATVTMELKKVTD